MTEVGRGTKYWTASRYATFLVPMALFCLFVEKFMVRIYASGRVERKACLNPKVDASCVRIQVYQVLRLDDVPERVALFVGES